MSQKELLTRDQIPVDRTWDTSTIFKTEEDFEAAYKAVTEFFRFKYPAVESGS